MSQENVEIVRLAFDAFQRRDWEFLQESSHSDVVIEQPPEVPDSKTYRGPNAFIEAAADWPAEWEDFSIELLEWIDVDHERVILITRHHGFGAASRIEMDYIVAYVHTLRESKLVRMKIFFSRAQALEAVGLRE